MASTVAVFWDPTIPTATAGGVVHGDGTKYSITPAGVAGQALQSNGASSPTFGYVPAYATNLSTSVVGTQNNYTPGLLGNTIEYWNGASDVTITGLAGGVLNQIYTFKNVSTHNAFFSNLGGGSLAANQFTNLLTSGSTPVAPRGFVSYVYDGTNWKIIAHVQGASIAWTPTDASGAGLVFLFAAGTYIVSGSFVKIDFQVNFPATANGANILIGGLPYAATPNCGLSLGEFGAGAALSAYGLINGGAATISFNVAGTNAAIINSQFSSGVMIASGTYTP